MTAQEINIKFGWFQSAEALAYAQDLERRLFNVTLVPILDGSDWRWHLTATKNWESLTND